MTLIDSGIESPMEESHDLIGVNNIQELGKLKIDSHSYNGEVSLTEIPGLYPLVQGYGEFFVKILGTRVIIK